GLMVVLQLIRTSHSETKNKAVNGIYSLKKII
ncbi:MAG: hypothetical protein ACJAS1_003999, partial [Oleiphilaceae bacterium]